MMHASMFLTLLVIALIGFAGWITHIFITIGVLVGEHAVNTGYAVLLAIGVFMPPIGVIHGIGAWFGAW